MKRKGAWNGKEDEFARLEQDIFRAQKERRILAPDLPYKIIAANWIR